MTSLLPEGFEDLERFADQWNLTSANDRRALRLDLSMDELREFYAIVQPRADAALSYIDRFPIDDLPEDASRLMRVLLGLTHAAMAIELHEQHRGRFAPPEDSLRVTADVPFQ